ncbi:MAG TPA: hypothetical protein VNG73_06350 [Gemmatimonadaceae bacterium]|nr:hypothetical protein [Gemmatimonadaceae bacterium]
MRLSTGISEIRERVHSWSRLLPTVLFVVIAAAAQTRTAGAAITPPGSEVRATHAVTSGAVDTRDREKAIPPEIVLTESPQSSSVPVGPLEDVEPRPTTPYELARQMAMNGAWDQAEALLKTSLANDPANGDLHRLSAEVSYYYYKDLGRAEALDDVAAHALRAFELALNAHSLDLRAADLVADTAAAVKDPAVLDRLFAKAALYDNSGHIALAHARALAALGSPRAEAEFRYAASLASDGNTEAVEEYAERLLDAGRASNALDLLARYEQSATNPYVHFLRGVALEHVGATAQAATEYAKYASFSAEYPAPARFRLSGSTAQASAGIRFTDEHPPSGIHLSPSAERFGPPVASALVASQAQQGLSYLIYGEANGEGTGAKRAEGWVVRNRVLRGSVYNDAGTSCPYVTNSGSTLADQYKTVMCQTSQFAGMCTAWCSTPSTTTCKQSADSTAAAADVYNGNAPDPVGVHCPSGFSTYGAFCDTATRCKGDTSSFRLAGGLSNRAASGTCPSVTCMGTGIGKTCGNGGYDNCFYQDTRYAYSGLTTYNATFTSSGQTAYSAAFSANAGMQKAHMEGPENSANPDFDMYLEKSCGSGCWTTVAFSNRSATVEDLSYSSSAVGTYRWRLYAFSGTGSLQLYTVRP